MAMVFTVFRFTITASVHQTATDLIVTINIIDIDFVESFPFLFDLNLLIDAIESILIFIAQIHFGPLYMPSLRVTAHRRQPRMAVTPRNAMESAVVTMVSIVRTVHLSVRLFLAVIVLIITAVPRVLVQSVLHRDRMRPIRFCTASSHHEARSSSGIG